MVNYKCEFSALSGKKSSPQSPKKIPIDMPIRPCRVDMMTVMPELLPSCLTGHISRYRCPRVSLCDLGYASKAVNSFTGTGLPNRYPW
jgi:hypothetical protein